MTQYSNEPMLDMFIFETDQLIRQLEEAILSGEQSSCYTQAAINEIFRIMHTIKGSAAMMRFENISSLAHSIEDMFYYLREETPRNINCSELSDLILECIDFIKIEIEKIKNGDSADGEPDYLIKNNKGFLSGLKEGNFKNKLAYKAVVFFEEGCEMENIRAYSIVHNLKELAEDLFYTPGDIIDNDGSAEVIRKEGFKVYFKADCSYEELHDFFMETVFLKTLELTNVEGPDEYEESGLIPDSSNQILKEQEIDKHENKDKYNGKKNIQTASLQQSIISVSVVKLDRLMDLVGEMVTAEAMVIQNPDLKGLELDNFQKAARQLNKITGEIQDMVMSIRMVPLSTTFHKMNRVVRDMCKKLGKEAKLEIIGEETEVDKNIIEHISDPLMHLVRNALDHGIEPWEDRLAKGKQKDGTITLEAKNSGSDVLIIIKDDGMGLCREKILSKARENGLLRKNESEMTDKEVFNLIFLPGFSTNENVTEFSGRGVGMDVVAKNIEIVGGSVSVDSIQDRETVITLKIPLTLAIIDGMNISVGNARYTIPTISIKESFKPRERDIITDPDGNEFIMVRGQCYPILRLHKRYKVKAGIAEFCDGVIVMVEQDGKTQCLFADELLGQQQVVVKAMPEYIKRIMKIKGLAGCTLLGDGSISLILDIVGLTD